MRVALSGAVAAIVWTTAGVAASETTGEVDLALSATPLIATVGDTIEVGIYAASDSAKTVRVSGIEVVLAWDATQLELTGFVDNGQYDWFMSGFLDDSQADGLNDSLLDGDAFYQAAGQPAAPAEVPPPPGLLVTTLQFRALGYDPSAQVTMELGLGDWSRTRVLEADSREDVTGSLIPASVTITPVRLWASDLMLPAGREAEVIVSGACDGQETFGVDCIVKLAARSGSAGTVTFTPAPPVDIEQRGDPWPLGGVFTEFDTDWPGFSDVSNGSADDNGTLLATPLTYSGPMSAFPVIASVGARGEWSIVLDPSGSTWWNSDPVLPTALQHGVLRIVEPGDGNADTAIDMLDFGGFQECFTDAGPADPPAYSPDPSGRCNVYDFDGDGAIDNQDLEEFLGVMGGP
jgi:hypothetical protein